MEEILQVPAETKKRIEEVISNEMLRKVISSDYNLGNYETSITKAFEFLEESIISNSPLKDPNEENLDIKTSEELKAVKFKLKGAMNWFREPESQNTSHNAAVQILSYVDLQLIMLRENNH